MEFGNCLNGYGRFIEFRKRSKGNFVVFYLRCSGILSRNNSETVI